MRNFRKYERKIRNYLSKISNIRFKEKLKKLVDQIGISYPDDFNLGVADSKEIIFPCHLGVLFCGVFEKKMLEAVVKRLEVAFDSFFYDIIDLGQYKFNKKMLSKGIKNQYDKKEKSRETSQKMQVHPTNKFYSVLIDKRIENQLDMIISITNLPIYSSNDNTSFLFGEAHLKHKCCVVSSLRLKEQFYSRKRNKSLLTQRIIKEVIHEIGHLILDSGHCENNSCVMRFSSIVQEIDSKSLSLCESCILKLENKRKRFNF